AVYLFDGRTGTLLSALVGSHANDQVGAPFSCGKNCIVNPITLLSNGNYVVASPSWNSGRGAVTWGSGTAGVSGTVDASNSLTGANPGDSVGIGTVNSRSGGVTALSNGNYVVLSPRWNGGRGAATWGSGTAGVSGVVSASNSLTGANPNDG